MRILEATIVGNTVLRRLLLLGVAALLATSLIACGSDDGGDDAPAASASEAEALASQFLTLLQKKDTAALQEFFADSFILQRANGGFETKDSYLTRLPEIGEFTISNVSHKQTGNALVVRWDLSIKETIEGQIYSGTPAPRLSTFVYVDDAWQMTSHANFNVPDGVTSNN